MPSMNTEPITEKNIPISSKGVGHDPKIKITCRKEGKLIRIWRIS